MLEGLEISVVSLSYALLNNDIFRFDSNYFKKEFLLDEKIIRKHKHETLKSMGIEIKSFGAYSLNNEINYIESGVPFIRGVNMKRGRINFSDMIYIDEQANNLLWKSEVKPEMILLSMSGTIGEVAIASKKWKYPINSNQDIAKIDTQGKINPYFLYAFLLSKFGQNYLRREARGSVQQHVFLSQIELFTIPFVTKEFNQIIQKTIEDSDIKILESEKLYLSADSLLLDAIGLQGFTPSEEPINIKSFKESFIETGRLDAEYYQKKYEDYVNLIKNYTGGWDILSNACDLKDSNFTPEETNEYKYIELSNIGKSGNITGCTLSNGIDLPSRARRLVNTNDVIISSIEGSLESCALVQQDYDNALCSTGFYVIKSLNINPQTLVILFKSEPMQKILKKNCSGTILTAINKDEFLKLPIPLIEKSIQKKIATLVEKSFALKKESEYLLEKAKRAVEIAIEKDEKAAIKFIESE